MQKQEVIQIHKLCYTLKEKIKLRYNLDEKFFTEYAALDVTPEQTFKSQTEHEIACFVLGKEIAQYLSHNDPYSGFGKTAYILTKLAARKQ